MTSSDQEKKRIIQNLYFPVLFLIIIWFIKLAEFLFNIDLVFLGVYPLKWEGLIGIITSPLIHGDWSHLMANTASFFVLSALLFTVYRELAVRSFFMIYVLSGIWLWFAGRDSYHIGASGVIYGLAAFLFVSGLIRKNPRLMSVTLVITFLYGSMIWGIFPEFFPKENISWEGHLMGLVAGTIVAVYYRKEGPQAPEFQWEDEDDEEDDDDPNAYWKRPIE